MKWKKRWRSNRTETEKELDVSKVYIYIVGEKGKRRIEEEEGGGTKHGVESKKKREGRERDERSSRAQVKNQSSLCSGCVLSFPPL